ncbi:phosphatase PAP2 family protein [Methylobacterium oryzisoli]|uniref:phosphatase PAP2 family protein n=1 Tax=Methylobacterium oryzisoli TaxID=3385502 RepID=UPI003891CE3C
MLILRIATDDGRSVDLEVASAAEAADIALAVALARGRNHPLMRGLAQVSEAGSQQALLALCGGLLAVGWLSGHRAAVRTGGRALAAHLAASAVKTTLKRLLLRTRPNEMLETGRYAFRRGRPDRGPLQSFPSGHAAVSVAVARSLARSCPELRGPALAAATAVTLIQVPRGAHYPADIVAGTAIGVVAERLAALVADRLSAPTPPPSAAHGPEADGPEADGREARPPPR